VSTPIQSLGEARELAQMALSELLTSWGARGFAEHRSGDPELLLEAASTINQVIRILDDHLKAGAK
jgi:hypothetical protein